MKKQLLTFTFISVFIFSIVQLNGQRFLSEVFPSVIKTQNVTYASNFSILTGAPVLENLMMDVYEPGGIADPMLHRPLIILMHPGSFLPAYINMAPTGSRNDSAIVEMCNRFAKRGYVVAAISYRLGSNPFATGPNLDIRKGTFIEAIYRAEQDAKCCVRYFREDEATTNAFKIDSNKVILGGTGSGGFVSLSYATLNNYAKIALPKFLSSNTIGAPYNYTSGQPYVNIAKQGDFDGYGGNASFNFPNNSPGHTNNVHFVFNIGGALCDSSWIDPGNVPMVAFHVVGDPYTPYTNGLELVPSTGDTLMQVSGSYDFLHFADFAGNNNCFINAGFSDPYTQHANSLNNGNDGLFPFATIPSAQISPWEWYDSLATVAGAQAAGVINGGAIFHNAVLDNPGMSKTKALAYIDTIMGYLNPRIVYCLNLVTGINVQESMTNSLDIYPNPSANYFLIKSENQHELISSIDVCDITGKSMFQIENINNAIYMISRKDIAPGIYILKIQLKKNLVIRKIILR
ncbi:MAG: T9SS type A sorting domain-containing protein [Bacteroidota bacterium]